MFDTRPYCMSIQALKTSTKKQLYECVHCKEDFQYPSYLECHLERVHFKKTKKKLNFESEESLPSGNASLYNEI